MAPGQGILSFLRGAWNEAVNFCTQLADPQMDDVSWSGIYDQLARVYDGEGGQALSALKKLVWLKKQPGGLEQLRHILLRSDVDVRELVDELPTPTALSGEARNAAETTTPARMTSPTAHKDGACATGSHMAPAPMDAHAAGAGETAEVGELAPQQLVFLSDSADSDEDCSSSELKSAGAIAYVGIHGPVHRRKHGHTMVDELQL